MVAWWLRCAGVLAVFGVFLPICASANAACPAQAVAGEAGSAQHALLVGINDYALDEIPDLGGAVRDSERMYDLLTGGRGYGFPKQNVCRLTDAEASYDQVVAAIEQWLVPRVSAGDEVVIYFAGHGSQIREQTETDEPDGLDETLVLHDSTRVDRQLTDDQFNALLKQVHDKTQNITVILDSCNSATATRGTNNTARARLWAREFDDDEPVGDLPIYDDYVPASLPGIVVLSAAADATAALETDGYGIFTDAIIDVLSKSESITYDQMEPLVRRSLKARTYQIPSFQGSLDRQVFNAKKAGRSDAWFVTGANIATVEVSGPFLAGAGIGALFRIYDKDASLADTQDPAKAKATIEISRGSVSQGTGVIVPDSDSEDIDVGDYAYLVRVSTVFRKLTVHFRTEDEDAGTGLDAPRISALKQAIESNDEAERLIEIASGAAEFEIARHADGRLQIIDSSGRVRNTLRNGNSGEATTLARLLWLHARQKALLSLDGEGGGSFKDDQTLRVSLVPAPIERSAGECAARAATDAGWSSSGANKQYTIPKCDGFRIRVDVDDGAPVPLHVGGIVVSTDGSLFGFPTDGLGPLVGPGEAYVFPNTFVAQPPLDVVDHILIFGTQESNQVRWNLLTETAATRSNSRNASSSALFMALDDYLALEKSRGGYVESSAWTMSTVPLKVVQSTN